MSLESVGDWSDSYDDSYDDWRPEKPECSDDWADGVAEPAVKEAE